LAPDRAQLDLSRPLNESVLPERVDAVIYLAQSDRFRDFPDGAADMFAVNCAGPAAMLDYARRAGARNFVLASTGGIYAPSADPIAEDGALVAPMGYYPASKRAAELAALAYSGLMNVAILRFFFIYGPGQKRHMLIPRLIDSVREGRVIALQGESGLRLNPVHVHDAARAAAVAAQLDHSTTLNIAGPDVMTIRAMAEAIGKASGREPLFEFERATPAADLVADIGAMTRLLGPPAARFADGIGELVS